MRSPAVRHAMARFYFMRALLCAIDDEKEAAMPHYKDGTEAKVGDVVKGKGYNVPHEIIGKLVHITPGDTACNVVVAHVGKDSPVYGQLIDGEFRLNKNTTGRVDASYEYGQADAFELLHR